MSVGMMIAAMHLPTLAGLLEARFTTGPRYVM